MDALASWRHGILYPHWTPSAKFWRRRAAVCVLSAADLDAGRGAGVGAAVDAGSCSALTFLFLAGTGLATQGAGAAGAAGAARPRWPAAWRIFSGYSLFTRLRAGCLCGADGRLLDSACAALYSARPRSRSAPHSGVRWLDGAAAPLALVLAGCWLSNAPLGVMACYLLAAVALTSPRCWGARGRRCCARPGAVLGTGSGGFTGSRGMGAALGGYAARRSTIPAR